MPPPRAPPPLEANFAVSLMETKLGLAGGWARGSAPRLPVPGRHATCCFGVAALGRQGAFPREPSCGSCFCRSSGKGDERKSPAGRWQCRGACPLESSVLAVDSAAWRRGGGGGGTEGWEGATIHYVNRMGMSEQGAAASQLQAAAAAPDARVSSWSHCWKSKRRRGAGLPGVPGARTSAAPWSWETSPTRSTPFFPVTRKPAKDLIDLAAKLILPIYEIVSTAEVR